MKTKKKKMLYIALSIFVLVIITVLTWFKIPYSPMKNEFNKDVNALLESELLYNSQEVFNANDFSHLPVVIQKYIENSKYIGTQKMNFLKMEYHDVTFKQDREGLSLNIDYTQYNFIEKPNRLAFIDSSLYGIPFEGYDYYMNGDGKMKGVIAKSITLFDQTGADMDKASLVTFLAESMFAPTILLQDYIIFEPLSDYEVKATISYNGISASGVFTFNEQYEMILFTTRDRAVVKTDGSIEYIQWSAVCSGYQILENGIKHPTKFQAVWNYEDGDFIYFDGVISKISYVND